MDFQKGQFMQTYLLIPKWVKSPLLKIYKVTKELPVL